jgi:hypothetical protein
VRLVGVAVFVVETRPAGGTRYRPTGTHVGDRSESLVVRKFLQRIGAEEARRAIKKAMVDQGIPEHAIEETHVDTVWMEILQGGT